MSVHCCTGTTIEYLSISVRIKHPKNNVFHHATNSRKCDVDFGHSIGNDSPVSRIFTQIGSKFVDSSVKPLSSMLQEAQITITGVVSIVANFFFRKKLAIYLKWPNFGLILATFGTMGISKKTPNEQI